MERSAALILSILLVTPAFAQEVTPLEEPPPADTMSADDIDARRVVYAAGDTRIALGGLLQLHLTPYVGSDSLLDDGDVAGRAGFRFRRARLGVDASFPHDLSFLLVLNPLESDDETGTISEAKVGWAPRPWFQIWAGADKVPFTRGELTSSTNLSSIERPLVVRTLVPQRRLGAVIEGAVLDDRLTYTAGIMNATEGYDRGNEFAGFLYVARVGFASALGPIELAVNAGGFFQDSAATHTLAGSADLSLSFRGATLLVEAICDKTTPDDSPSVPPDVADDVTRCGGYVEASYRLPEPDLQGVVRVELLDDHLDVDDAGDGLLFSVGVNYRLNAHLRGQLHYLGRAERHGAERANDAVVLSLQGEL
jgi:Phosphate-selective porin O and P